MSVSEFKLLQDISNEKRRIKMNQTYILVSPNQVEYIVTNLKEFCRNNNLNYKSLLNVSRGKAKTYKGWKCDKQTCDNLVSKSDYQEQTSHTKVFSQSHKEALSRSKCKQYVVLAPWNEEFIVDNLKKFCYDNELNYKVMLLVANGTRDNHYGWICCRKEVD